MQCPALQPILKQFEQKWLSCPHYNVDRSGFKWRYFWWPCVLRLSSVYEIVLHMNCPNCHFFLDLVWTLINMKEFCRNCIDCKQSLSLKNQYSCRRLAASYCWSHCWLGGHFHETSDSKKSPEWFRIRNCRIHKSYEQKFLYVLLSKAYSIWFSASKHCVSTASRPRSKRLPGFSQNVKRP